MRGRDFSTTIGTKGCGDAKRGGIESIYMYAKARQHPPSSSAPATRPLHHLQLLSLTVPTFWPVPKGCPPAFPHTHYYQSTLHIIASSPLPSYVDRSKRSKGCVTRARFNPPPPRRRRAINKYIEKKISPLRSLLAPPISTLLINSGSMLRKGCCCVCIAIYFSNKRICICKALH